MTAPSSRLGKICAYHLCDSCIDQIQYCATCGKELGNAGGRLRISKAPDAIHVWAWPPSHPLGAARLAVRLIRTADLESPAPPLPAVSVLLEEGVYVDLTWEEFRAHYGVRPTQRDLIVADCLNGCPCPKPLFQ